MTKDLEETLQELGFEYRAVVGRLRAAYEPPCGSVAKARRRSRFVGAFGLGAAGLAASLLVALAMGVVFRPSAHSVRTPTAANEYALAQSRSAAAVAEMIRTQNPDGSWKTDYLTRQNAAALRLCASGEAQLAYKKAMRNLRVRQAL